jgi:23S rRNA (guanine2445-N2)-methyltransferase / 23S rRNA (guanine2069-N7)-methyltransferase
VTTLNKKSFVANCAAGLEELLHKEIVLLGGNKITTAKGVIFFEGDLEIGYKACLWSRFASRILLQFAEFEIADDTALYECCSGLNWQEHLEEDTSFAVDCTLSENAVLNHSHFASLRVKDAIVDQFRTQTGERPSVKVDRPDVRFNLHVEENRASLAIDLSGESLHKRGYRVDSGSAPLKETLAAAIVSFSGWLQSERCYLLDPMCGSGTLLIEAALMFGDSAPGLSRRYFGFLGWKKHDSNLWNSLVDDAIEREEKGQRKKWPVIMGYDSDPRVVAVARKNIERAGLEEKIHIKQAELASLGCPDKKGVIISNLPFGERLSETEQVSYLYKAFGRKMQTHFKNWQVALFISKPELSDRFEIQWDSRYRLYNGPLTCRLLVGKVQGEKEDPFIWSLSAPAEGDGLSFANRFKKNMKEKLKWSKREGISCFRVYDKDLPEFNLAVDIYGKWIHVQEYAPPKSVDSEVATKRFNTALTRIREVLGARKERVFIKTRSRQRGKVQYEKKGSRKKMFEVAEGNCYFLVNFTDYLDTGIFLDHRPMRKMIAEKASGKRFLNLFGYTGTATVHAAKAGALSTTTVDLSATYLHWTTLNLSLNGLTQEKHETIKADTLEWLKETRSKYDLIFVDPPTFSNTKKSKRIFDVQRDHVVLIQRAMQLLDEGGILLFSTNFRRFVLDKEIETRYTVKNITKMTVPYDFKRNNKIHQSWQIER